MFRVRALNDIGSGQWSVPVDVTPGASSSIITNVTVTSGNEQIAVTWTVDPDKVDDLKRRYDILSQGENDETT